LEKYELAVVGAGPAGSMAAYRAAKLGLKVLLLEEHGQAGSPPHCAGKLSVKAFQEFSLPSQCVLNKVRGALFHSPGNLEIQVSKPNPESYIIDRELFDRRLAEEALKAGVEARFKCKVKRIEPHTSGSLIIKGSGLEAKASFLILAEGGVRRLSVSLGSGNLPVLKGIQAEMEDVNLQGEDFVEVFFGWKFFPGFFGWIIPMGSGRAKVGLCVREGLAEASPRAYLEKALREHPTIKERVKRAKIRRVYGGLIPVEGPVRRMWHPSGILIVGDAAGHAKSTTGGGIFFGLKAGWLAGEAAVKSDTSSSVKTLAHYERECLKFFGGELEFTRKVRWFLNSLNDEEMDRLFRFLSSNIEALKTIEKHGDTAYQSKLWKPLAKASLKQMLRKPENLKTMGKILLKGLRSMTS
jgi:geranylgeranyl reductase family protein